MGRFLQRLVPYLRAYIGRLGLSVVGTVLVALATAAVAFMVKPVLDDIFIARDREMLRLLPPVVVLTYAVLGLGRFLQMYNTAYVGEEVVRRIRNQMVEHMLGLDLSFFYRTRGGELISRTTNDFARIRTAVSQHLPVLFREALVVLGLAGVVFYHSPRLALIGLLAIPVSAYPLAVLAKRIKRLSHRSQEKDSDITVRLAEILNNMEIIKAHSAEQFEAERFRRDALEFRRLNMKGVKARELASPVLELCGSIAIALVIAIGGFEVVEGRLSTGTFFSFSTALFMLYTPLKRMSYVYNHLYDAVAASERIFDMMGRQASIRGGSHRLSGPIERLEFDNVSLQYDHPRVLRNVCFRAQRGETIALVGDSGGGKTSMVNLILRLYDPTEGRLLVDGIDAASIDLADLRDRIGIVTQRIFIFNDTVAANVAYGSPVDPDRVRQALDQAGAMEFVSQLEHGIDSRLEDFGTNLSGGQRQRLAIARAIYKNPDILILDEATSALDNRSEALIHDALAGIIKDKITFVIAHRLSTVDLADRIMVVKGGRIVCSGEREELMRDCPEYQRLVQARSGNARPGQPL